MSRILISALIPLFLMGCTTNNVKEDDSLKPYFDSAGVTGCFALFNNSKNDFTIYNLGRYRDSSYTPASTFKIVNSLIGIQTGKISDENMVIKWDGIVRPNADWNKDLSMKEAFAVSAVPYFQEVARRIGHDTLKRWIDSLGYGNRDIGGPVDSFWLNNTLKVKPDEELGLVKKLYFGQLPFFRSTQEIVTRVMLREQNSNYKLSYKTGLGTDENGNQIGWVVGWIEENKHPYFFVLNLETPDKTMDLAKVRLPMLRGILSHFGFFNGKK
jgi:beta-lactamase class D